ncbi:tripartite motif-containing protein 2-like [Haliotis rubra]|uniref:tripartite motif-containing protein 2-like n=1 Tax=Haliotis rubra TaxID=36100 RepID=UPI001EE5710F|nr:tripartite motif-containing protein 2-like [Haliotis rubra]
MHEMATAKKLTDNHLTCAICTEVFTDPATLQCNHTFCKSCLLKYTKTQTEAIQAKSIPCPSCRQQTNVTSPDSPVEEWVSHLKPSHVIQSLMDDLGGSSDVDACSVCKEDGKTTPGTMWCTICEAVFCDGCLKLHKKMPLSRHHEVFDVRIRGNRKPKVRSFMCRIHKDEKIKLFCKDCRMTICTVCCSIKHRKCDDVETIDVMMTLVKETLVNETRNQEKKIQTYIDNISLTNSNIEKLTTSAQEMKDEVRKVRIAATDVLVRKEKELLDRIDELTESRVQELKAYRKSKDIDLQVEQQCYEFTDKAVTSDCVADMFDMYESMDGASRDEDGREDKRPQTSSIIFLHDIDMLMRSVDDVMLGEVIVGSDRTSTPVLLETIVFSRDRIGLIDLSDVLVCAVDGIRVITVVDYLNCRLSTQYVQNKTSLKKHLQLPSGPEGIAKVGGTKAAVTLPDTQEIAFIEFDPEPTLQSNVKTKRKYRGLAFLNPAQLVAGRFDGPTSVDLLDMGGNVLKSISTGVIGNPRYIHVTRKNNVVVSEASVTSLISVTIDGQAVFTFTPRGDRALEYPCGITTTSTGDILLVDRHSLKVIQLTESGQFVRDVLTPCDDLWYPTGICLDDDGLLYVTSGGYVKVFGCE